jgi:hypothetical protein
LIERDSHMNQSSESLPGFEFDKESMQKQKGVDSKGKQPSETLFGGGDHLVVPVNSTQKTRQRGLVPVLLVFLLTLMGAIIGFLAGRYASPFFSALGTLGTAWLIVLLVLLLYVVLIIHECGHLLGGRLVGSRFMLLIVGPLRILREQRGIRVGLNKNLAAYGGMAASMPQGEQNIQRKMLVMVAGGPVASLLFALLAGGLGLWPGLLPKVVALLFVITALLSALIFVGTSIPTYTGGFFTDGARILMLLKGGPGVERWSANTLLNSLVLAGRLPREWSPVLLQKSTAIPDGTLDDAVGCSFAYYYNLDTGNIAEARKFLQRQLMALDQMPSIVRPNFLLEAAYFEARYHANAETARRWLEQARGGIVERATRLRVEAAVLLAEGRKDEARVRIQEGLRNVKNAMYLGSGRLEEVLLQSLLMAIVE